MFMGQNQEKKTLQTIIDHIPHRTGPVVFTGMQGAERAWLVSRLLAELRIPVTVILPDAREAEIFTGDLRFFSDDARFPVYAFMPYHVMPFKPVACHNQTAAERIRILYRMTEARDPGVTVTTVEAVQQRLIPKPVLSGYAELVMPDEELDRDSLIEKMIAGGYTRVSIVEEPGDFSVRGGILDVFSPLYGEPVRIEFFGDMVESLRFFSAASQRTREHIREAVILPAREAVLDMAEMDKVVNRIRTQAGRAGLPGAKTREFVERVRQEGIFPEIEKLLPLIYAETDTFFDYFPENGLVILVEPERIAAASEEFSDQSRADYAAACTEKRLCPEPDQFYLTWAEIQEQLRDRSPLSLKALAVESPAGEPVEKHHFSVTENDAMQETLRRSAGEREEVFQPLADWINENRRKQHVTVLVSSGRSRTDQITEILSPYAISLTGVDQIPDPNTGRGRVYLCEGDLSAGFVWPDAELAILTDTEIFGVRRRRKPVSKRRSPRTDLLTFEDLTQGDLVVHTEHGIGRYEGLVKLKLNGTTNDFLLLYYKDDDRLYLPVERMNMIQKYMGVDGFAPVLDKMGGTSWQRVKGKVKKSVEKIAGDLLKLYARRRVREGYSFDLAHADFRSFESEFPYEETPDQLRAIRDVIHDMAASTPMDRLICGDVGYGKTEVALRASYLAVNNFKQVAVLVPTTVLAEQHYDTFSRRFSRYPVSVACLSRFRTAKEQRAILDDLKEGKVDIIVGTHRLLQKDVAFKELGLVVLDEEQRFGVKHKEMLKKLRSTVDVLALTATPIPRTLHMSLVGIRDISIISTPPEQRRPIITYVSEFDDSLAADAIRRELRRGGQIFFVHNTIQTIDRMAEHLQKLVPEVRLAVAHGQMNEAELEKVMFRFTDREIDLLLSTTIIESGLDIPGANTILINRADRFGLSQIYQLRGRVGRTDEQAYAYLFIPKESGLTRDAQKRLKVLMEHSDLGSGFQIAMSDLKIRGGGTILGASQSGHIAAVGYDMFLKLMEEAVADLKGEPVQEDLEPEINIPLSAYIAEDYIPDIDQRLTAYRRLTRMSSLKDIPAFKAELQDRFGPLPEETSNLLFKIMLRILAVQAGVKRVDLAGGQLSLHFSEGHQKNPFAIVDMITGNGKRFQLTRDHVLKVRLEGREAGSPLAQTKNILKEITQRVNA